MEKRGERRNRNREDLEALPELDLQTVRIIARFLRRWLRRFFAVYVVLFVLFLVVVEIVGERNLFTTFFLFLPPLSWLVPLGCFAGAATLLLDWRLIATTIALMGGFVWFYLDLEINGVGKGKGGSELTVLTFNRGQAVGSLVPFKDEHEPDVIAMQEAGANRYQVYMRDERYAELTHGDDVGEFMLLSKFPIKDKGLVEVESEARVHQVAGWFVLDLHGVEIVIYNVHFDTPRDQLKAFRRGAFLRGLWPFSESARSYQSWWDRQIYIAEKLREHIDAESRPVIVVGDFNTPDHGYIYRKVSRGLQDSHEKRGRGFGWTFPGKTRNPLALFGPWLRIDHQFAGKNWRVLSSVAERGRNSQHLAVVATYELRQ